MAKTLWLLRHGDAEGHGRGPDFDRRLTERGEHQARAAGRGLSRLGVTFELVFASPRVRARETARIACGELGIEPILHEPLGGAFGADDAAELIAATSEDCSLMLVGHEPGMSGLVAALTGGYVAMKKGGLAAIRLAGARGELVLLLRPREIELLAGG
ncbi:MAG: histidine phosphatase family protein [Solirubrobacteraceae bacterium]|jgi:phosphohistidine phosphatase